MSYRVSATGTASKAGSTPVVPVIGAVAKKLPHRFSYAIEGATFSDSGLFLFYEGTTEIEQVQLPVIRLDGVLVGQRVLIEATTDRWQLGTVTTDGTMLVVPGQPTFPLTTRAVPLSSVLGYVAPPPKHLGKTFKAEDQSSDVFELLDVSASGFPWFSTVRLGVVLATTAIATLADVTPGTQVLVEISASPSVWRVYTS